MKITKESILKIVKIHKKSVLIGMAVLAIALTSVSILAKSGSYNILSFLKINPGASAQNVAIKSVDYLNKNVLQEGQTATLLNSSEESGVIKFQIKFTDKTYDSYATKDSKLLFLDVFTVDVNAKPNSDLSPDAIAKKSVEYINKNILQEGQTAELVNTSEESGVIKFQIKLADKTYDNYATKDGKFLFPRALGITTQQNVKNENTFSLGIFFTGLKQEIIKNPIIAYLFPKLSQNANSNTISTASSTGNKVYDEVVAAVTPEKGFQSKITLGDSVVKLVANGVIDPTKFGDIYKSRGGFPEGFKDVLTASSNKPILITKSNSNFYINLLWPLGISNYTEANKTSPINGKDLNNFASTGGWNLGKSDNGGEYFNKFAIAPLTKAQEDLAISVAKNIYRPCCGNSTFFQDCNHGSALLGLLELGASQGLTEDDLYKEALAFNSFWFPQNYVQLGLYFKAIKNTDWKDVDPKLALGKDYSSSGGNAKIQSEVAKIPNLIPLGATYGGGSCGA